MSSLLLRGFALGFAVAASPGPIFFLCLRRSLVRGRLYGILSGFGVATADAFYAAVAVFGIGAVATLAAGGQRWLTLAGGIVLVLVGAVIALSSPQEASAAPSPTRVGLAWAYASTLGLTITNLATIISFAALAATLGIGIGGGYLAPLLVVLGVLLGSATWWCFLAVLAGAVRSRITPPVVRGISTLSGVAIAVLGLAAVYSVVRPW